MLIDDFMPKYDFAETHGIKISASVENIFMALNEADLCESWIIRGLFFLRGLPTEKMTLKDMRSIRFETLGKTVNKEILLGLAGKFWTIKGQLQKVNSNNFIGFNKKSFAKAVWSFSINGDGNENHLATETRIQCLDDESLKSFGFYWRLIKPFSGLIRNEMLKTVKKKAEAARN
ncbi:MAG: hypothetical protein AAB336_10555 [Acidobacteriota bacterium]